MLAILLLAWSWAIVGILLETAIWILPPVLVFLGCYWGLRAAGEVRRIEREKPQTADDITFAELSQVLLIATCSSIITGMILFWLILLKSPLIFMGVMYHGSWTVLEKILGLTDHIGAWVLLILIAFCVGFCLMLPCVGLAIAMSWLMFVTLATLWPPYVAHYGWPGQRRQRFNQVVWTGACTAAYQVLWIADLLTNAAIVGRSDIPLKVFSDCEEIAKGRRLAFSLECQSFAKLPPISLS